MRIRKKHLLKFTKAFDTALGWIVKPSSNWTLSQADHGKGRTIYFVENSRIGDSLMAIPTLKILLAWSKKMGFEKRILIASKFSRPYLEHLAWDEIKEVNPVWAGGSQSAKSIFLHPGWKFAETDVVVDLKGDPRSLALWRRMGAVNIAAATDGGGKAFVSLDLGPADTEENSHQMDQVFYVAKALKAVSAFETCPKLDLKNEFGLSKNTSAQTPCCVLHTESSERAREWNLANWLELSRRLSKDFGLASVLVVTPGSEREKEAHELFRELAPKNFEIISLPLKELPLRLATCSHFIGTDSFVGHLASGLGLKGLSIYAHTEPSFTLPRGIGDFAVLQKAQLSDLSVEEVLAAFSRIFT